MRQLSSTTHTLDEGVRIMTYLLPLPLASACLHYVLLYFCLHHLLVSSVDDSMCKEEEVD